MEITDLEIQLNNGVDEFVEKTIHIVGNGLFISESDLEFIKSLSFHNCKFIGTHLEFENIDLPDFKLGFFDCEFQISLDIKNCNFKRLGLRDVKSNKSIDVGGNFKDFFFRNNNLKAKEENLLTGNINISNLIVTEKFELDYINHIAGEFNFSENVISILQTNRKEKINFKNSTFSKAKFNDSKFLSDTSFVEMEIKKECVFEECEFDKVNFSNLFIGKLSFFDCKFFKTSVFHYIEGNISSSISIESCLFEKYIQFNGTSTYKFIIDNVEFKKIASFQETYFDIVSIERVVFERGALFDNIQIKKVNDCNRRTLRTVKQELQKAENKIDYNKFRVYEFNAYRVDIKNKLKEIDKDKNRFYHRHREPFQLKRDAFVLWISDIVSEYGTDWKRALNFTLLWGFFIYLLFYSIENYNHTIEILNWYNWKRLISGLFRFFLVTDFYNPLENGRIYLTNPLSWIVFMFGKIVIAFGIYEMIQSFRKFKA